MDLTWLGWRTQANTFFFSWDPIAWRDMLEEDLVLVQHMRKDQWRPGQVQWWWSTCPLPVALGWYRQPPHICHPATKIYSPCFYRSSVGASHLTRWKPVQGGKRHFGLLLAIQVNLDKSSVTWKSGVWLFWRGLTSDGSKPISWASMDMSFGVWALATWCFNYIQICYQMSNRSPQYLKELFPGGEGEGGKDAISLQCSLHTPSELPSKYFDHPDSCATN